MASNLVDCVIHWKKKLDKYPDDEDVLLRTIHKLSKVPITPEILEATHIGKAIRNLSKRNSEVGEKAKIVLNKWRNIFVDLQSAKNSKQKSISKKDYSVESSSKNKLTPENHEKVSSQKQKERPKKSPLFHSSFEQFSEKQCNASLFSDFNLEESVEKLFYLKNLSDEQSMEGNPMYNLDCPKTSDDDNDKRKNPNLNVSSLKRKLVAVEKSKDYVNSDAKKFKSGNHSSSNGKIKEKHKVPKDKDESLSHSVKKEKSSHVKENSSSHVKENSSSHVKENPSSHSKKDNSKEKTDSKTKTSVQSSDGFTATSASFEDCLGFNDIVTVKKKSSKSQSSTSKPNSPSVHSQKKIADKKVTGSSGDKKKTSSSGDKKKTSSSADKKKTSNSADKKVSGKSKDKKETGNSPDKKATGNSVDKKASKTSKEKSTHNEPEKSIMYDIPIASSSFNSVLQSTSKSSQNQCSKKESISNEDVIKFTSSRKEKTAIYSGRKNFNRTFPTLAQCCYRVLIENIDILGPMGDTPYDLLKPVLEKCSPNQLFDIERYNPHLLDSTNELWEIHCKRDYKLHTPLEHETWRDVYLRAFDEREKKLEHIKANIFASKLKAAPVRQLKLAYVDSFVKPPREVLRRQAKHGLLDPSVNAVKPESSLKENTKKIEIASSSAKSNRTFISDKKDKTKASTSSSSETVNHLPSPKGNTKPVASVVDPTAVDKDIIALSQAAKKPKMAPLMAKSIKTLKQCFRR